MAKDRLPRFSNFDQGDYLERKLNEKRKTLEKRKKQNESQRKKTWFDQTEDGKED